MAIQIAATTAAAVSADFTVASGSQIALFLIPASGQILNPNCHADIYYKNGTDYIYIGSLSPDGIKITAPGTYRVGKTTTGASFGVSSEA